MRETTVFSTDDVEKTEYLPAKELVQTLTLHYLPKINSIWIKVLTVGPETTRLLEGNIGKLLDILLSNIFWMSPQTKESNLRINKQDYNGEENYQPKKKATY